MTRAVLCLLVVALSTPASAEEPSTTGRPPGYDPIGKARAAHERGDFAEARRILLDAYVLVPNPALLFAIGQEELNLGNYDAAIRYYEQFIATNPSEDQVALAQQAIGAARMRRAQPKPRELPPSTPVVIHHRRWRIEDTGLVTLGGLAIVLGSGLTIYSRSLANDRSGTLADYDGRLDNARTTRWTGTGIVTGGALLIGVSVLRWRLRPDGPAMTAALTHGGGGFALVGAW